MAGLSVLPPAIARAYVRHVPGSVGKSRVVGAYLNDALREAPRRRRCRTRFGARFNVDTQDLIQRYIYMFGVWEPNLTGWLSSRLKPGDVFVDVGANVGYYSVLGARLVGPSGGVVAVEASPPFAELLRENLRLNGAGNVRVVNQAVSDREETVSLVLASSANMGANSIVPYEGPIEARYEVPASPLHQLLSDDEVQRARVIKIDVEGAEGKAVRGLAPLLGGSGPMLRSPWKSRRPGWQSWGTRPLSCWAPSHPPASTRIVSRTTTRRPPTRPRYTRRCPRCRAWRAT